MINRGQNKVNDMNKILSTLLLSSILITLGGCSKDQEEVVSKLDTPGQKTSLKKKKASATTYALMDDSSVSSTDFHSSFSNSKHTYLFTINGTQLESTYLKELDSLSTYLKQHPEQKVHIDGFTCELGSSEYNIALGYRTAQSIVTYLEEHGASKDQCIIVSYGKEKPVDRNHNESAWIKNRRVEAYF